MHITLRTCLLYLRLPCPAYTTTQHNYARSPGWWFKPDFIINELNINSAVSAPWHDEVLPLGTNNNYTMKGYAYTGGCCDGVWGRCALEVLWWAGLRIR